METKQRPVRRILVLLKSRRRTVVFLLILVTLATSFDIAVPIISQRLIDNLIQFFTGMRESPVGFLVFSALGILLATVVSRFFRTLYDYRLFKLVTTVEDEVRHDAFLKYTRLHALFHHGASGGQIIGRIERGGISLYSILHDIFGHNLLPPLIVFLGVLGTLIAVNPLMATVVFLPLPIYLISIRGFTRRIYEIEKQAIDQFDDVSKESYDVASNVITVKKFAQEAAEADHQAKLRSEARITQYGAERLWNIIENIQTFIATMGRISVILMGGFLVLNGTSTVGEFVLYVTLQNMAYAPLSQLSVTFPRLRRNVARAERMFEILDEQIRVTDKPDAHNLPRFEKVISFSDVWFRYGPERQWAIKDAHINIERGKTVALVGRSGSGKTTFINLLLRSFDPERGTISIDGHDLRDVKRESLLDQIAVVPQEVDLFSRTILQNIAYGATTIDREEVMRAAKTALAHDFIMKAEKGYDTVVGERGIKLSGGERQRIGIARAIFRDPRILILDEATSHLDTESERLITEATNALIKNRTTFIIAHRLSTVLDADMILVFHNGTIEAVGTHEELLKTNPTYQRLYSLQFRNES